MSSECSSSRKKIFVALLTLATLALLAGGADARNPNLSNWTLNLSGDEPPGETWNDRGQEIEVVGNTVHVTYWSEGASWRLYYRRSTDGGQTWEPKILLYDTNPGGSSSSQDRDWKFLAVDGNHVHVAYAAYHPGYPACTLMYRRSTNYGASFEDARQLAPDSGGWWWIGPTRIAANAGKVTIAFQFQVADGGAWVNLGSMNSGDGGENFTYSQVATSGDRWLGVSVDDLKRVGDRVYVLYRRDLETGYDVMWNTALYCATSLDGGTNFTQNLMTTLSPVVNKYLTYRIQEASYSPNLAVDGNNVYVIWTQNNGYYTSNEIFLYLRRSTDQGLTFGEPIQMAKNQTDGIGDMRLGMETVAANGGYVYVMLMTYDGSNSIVYLKRSTDSGAAFLPLQTMGTGAWWPNMVVDPANGAKVHVFWWYTYRYSADGGASFTNPVVLMPFVANFGGDTGVQMALGPGDTKHFTVPLRFCTNAYGWGDRDIFYRCFGPVPAPSGRNQAFKTISNYDEARYDCMEVASTQYLNFAARISAEVWVKPQAGGVNTGYTDDKKLILHKLADAVTPGGNRLYSLGTYTYGDTRRQAIAELRTTDGWYELSAGYWQPIGLVPDNAWTHLAFTYDAWEGENNFKLYKNGQLIASMTATGIVSTGYGNFFAGYYGCWEMNELRLWHRTLTESEINNNMRRKLAGTEPGLNAYYPFSDTTKDMTGHGNDGIVIYQESYVASTRDAAALPEVNLLLLLD